MSAGDRPASRQARRSEVLPLTLTGAAAEGGMDEIEKLLEEKPEASAGFAVRELHYGRLEWLAEHIRLSNLRIDPLVAEKLLAMIEGSETNCYFELKAVRRSELPPRFKDPQLTLHRNLDMAIEVARRSGFKRGHIQPACEDVGVIYGLKGSYVAKQVRPFRKLALDVVKEEQMQMAYEQGEEDILDGSK